MTENQISEMFKLMTTAVTKLNEYDARFERLEKGQDELRQGQDELRQDVTSLRQDVTSLRQGQDELRQGQEAQGRKLDGFIEETRQNFVEVKNELRQTNRKVNRMAQDVMEVRAPINDLEDRIEILEEKQAA